jgi:hypothetical protein
MSSECHSPQRTGRGQEKLSDLPPFFAQAQVWQLSTWQQIQIGGFNSSEKYDFVSWDDEIPIYYGK